MNKEWKINLTKAQQKQVDAYKKGKDDGYALGYKAGEINMIKRLKEEGRLK